MPPPQDVVLLIDNTVFGSAKDGVLITANLVSLKEMFSDPIHIDMDEIAYVEADGSYLEFNDKDIDCTMVDEKSLEKIAQMFNRVIYVAHMPKPVERNKSGGSVALRGGDNEPVEKDSGDSIGLNLSNLDSETLKMYYEKVRFINERYNGIVESITRHAAKVKESYGGIYTMSPNSVLTRATRCGMDAGFLACEYALTTMASNYLAESKDTQEPEEVIRTCYVLLSEANLKTEDFRKNFNNFSSMQFAASLEEEMHSANEREYNFLESYREAIFAMKQLAKEQSENRELFRSAFYTALGLAMSIFVFDLLLRSKEQYEKNPDTFDNVMSAFDEPKSFFAWARTGIGLTQALVTEPLKEERHYNYTKQLANIFTMLADFAIEGALVDVGKLYNEAVFGMSL